MERYHNFCEYYMYKTLSDHEFYVVDNNTPFISRPLPENAHITPWLKMPWDKIDVGYAVTYERFKEVQKHNKPCVFHIDQVPQVWDKPKKLAELIEEAPTMYWSDEEADMWQVGTPFVRPHPIDTNVFFNYSFSSKPKKPMAITIATRAFKGWGQDLKGYRILKDAYNEVPIQVIAKNDKDFANAKEITSEKDMIKELQSHQVYFNCAWKLDRSPLEAMACGMPVVALKTPNNVYLNYFIDGENIIYANDTNDMIEKTKMLLENKQMAFKIGQKARDTIMLNWYPEISKTIWESAFKFAIENK